MRDYQKVCCCSSLKMIHQSCSYRSLILLFIPLRRQFFVKVFQNFHGTLINFIVLIQSEKIFYIWDLYTYYTLTLLWTSAILLAVCVSDFHCDLKWWPIMTILVSFLFKSSSKLEPELLCCRLKHILLFKSFKIFSNHLF